MASAAAGFDPEKGPQLFQDSNPSLSTSSSEEEKDDENREYSYARPQDHPSLMCPTDDEEFEKVDAERRRKKPVRISFSLICHFWQFFFEIFNFIVEFVNLSCHLSRFLKSYMTNWHNFFYE
jgi:hypothetical protein